MIGEDTKTTASVVTSVMLETPELWKLMSVRVEQVAAHLFEEKCTDDMMTEALSITAAAGLP